MSMEMPPHEDLYGRKGRSPVYWEEFSEQKIGSRTDPAD